MNRFRCLLSDILVSLRSPHGFTPNCFRKVFLGLWRYGPHSLERCIKFIPTNPKSTADKRYRLNFVRQFWIFGCRFQFACFDQWPKECSDICSRRSTEIKPRLAPLRSPSSGQPSRQPAAGATQAVTLSADPLAGCHFASDKDKVSVTILAGWRRFSSARVSSWLPASRLAVLCALTEIVMRAHSTSSRAARRWHCTVGIRWQRWQSAVSGLYFRRVTAPVQFWLACGRPAAFRPALPWWHQLVYSYLRLTGWVRRPRRERPV